MHIFVGLLRNKFGAYKLNDEGTYPSDSITRIWTSTNILVCDKIPVQLFDFDSKTARPIVPLECAALVV